VRVREVSPKISYFTIAGREWRAATSEFSGSIFRLILGPETVDIRSAREKGPKEGVKNRTAWQVPENGLLQAPPPPVTLTMTGQWAGLYLPFF